MEERSSIAEYQKALGALKEALAIYEKEENPDMKKLIQDASIQRFEFCVELAWKTSLKVLGLKNMPPKPAVREMAQGKLIDNVPIWFDFIEARNKSSHTYDENIARQVFAVACTFLPEGEKLLSLLSQK